MNATEQFIETVREGEALFVEYAHLTRGEQVKKVTVHHITKTQIHVTDTTSVFGSDGWQKTSDKWAKRARLLKPTEELKARYVRQHLLAEMHTIRFEDLPTDTLLAMHKAYMAGKQVCEQCHERPAMHEPRAVLLTQDEAHPTMAERSVRMWLCNECRDALI